MLRISESSIGGKLINRGVLRPLCVFLLVTSCCVERTQAGRHFMGFQGGANVSTFSTEEDASIESTNGYALGIIGVFRLTPWLAFQPEATYTTKGARGSASWSSRSNDSIEGSVELGYLELPLLLRIMVPAWQTLTPHVFAGPAVAANFTAKAEGTWGTRPFTGDIQSAATDGDLGLVIGGGVDFGLRTSRISLDIRYTHGLLPVDETNRLPELKNRVWTVSAAILFPVGR